MELNTATLDDMTALAAIIWHKEQDSLPLEGYRSGMFKVWQMPSNTGEQRKISEVDLEEYADDKDESDQAARASVQQGYDKTLDVKRKAKDIGISYEMRRFNKYPEVIQKLTNIVGLVWNRLDLDLQHRIGFGASASYTNKSGVTVTTTTGDGYQLFYTAHKLKGSSSTYRNRLANNPQLSEGALEAMERMKVENTYNHLGEKKTMPFDILWTTDDPNTINTALKLMKSMGSVDATHSGVTNPNQGKYRIVKLSRVATTAAGAPDTTKRRYWGIASSRDSSAILGMWDQPYLKVPRDLNAGEEFSTDDWNFGTRGAYAVEILNGSWIGMSSGDGTA